MINKVSQSDPDQTGTYKICVDGKKINPAYYFHNDLSPEEFDRMLELSSQENQSFD